VECARRLGAQRRREPRLHAPGLGIAGQDHDRDPEAGRPVPGRGRAPPPHALRVSAASSPD
jgi:hypothetical protein